MENEREDRRQHLRKPVSMQVSYRSLDTFFYDYALNISYGGIFIKTEKPLDMDSPVDIEFEAPGAPGPFQTSGKVVRVISVQESEAEPVGMGIEFEQLSDEDKSLIDALWAASASRCPQCGLVHPPMDKVCRRCEIDLKTGEHRPRVEGYMAQPEATSILERFRGRLKTKSGPKVKVEKAARPAQTRTEDLQKGVEAARPVEASAPVAEDAKTGASLVDIVREKGFRLSDAIQSGLKGSQMDQINCVQCSSSMFIGRSLPFSKSSPVALLVMGGGLVITGFFSHLLWITAFVALALGIIYLRLGSTFWKCDSCGFSIPRAG